MADDSLERAIAGALRAAIRAHGPITPEYVGSAAKRVAGNLKNARLDGMATALGRKGGIANKESGANFKKLGARGGRAGKGVPKPRSEEAKRRMLARRLLRAAVDGWVPAWAMRKLAPEKVHETVSAVSLELAAEALGVAREIQQLTAANPRG